MITLRKTLLIFVFTVFGFFLSCNSSNKNNSLDGVEYVKPSKIRDVFSMLSLGLNVKPQRGPLTDEEARSTISGFFQAMRMQNPMSASAFLSEGFTSLRFADKRDFERSFKRSMEKLRVLKLDFQIEEIAMFDNGALARIMVRQVLAYLRSGLIQDISEERYLWLKKGPKGTKIVSMVFGDNPSMASIKDGKWVNGWFKYRFNVPLGYMIIPGRMENTLEYIMMKNKSVPVTMYFSTVYVGSKVHSALEMAESDSKFMQNLEAFKINAKKRYPLKNYDTAILDFSSRRGYEDTQEMRVYVFRKPLMYVLGIYSSNVEAFDKGKKDFAKIMNSFEYVKSAGKFEDANLLPFVVSGPDFKSNVGGFSVRPPVNWALRNESASMVQYVPVVKSVDAIVSVGFVDTNAGLEDFANRREILSKAAFRKYEVLKKEKRRFLNCDAYYLKSRFKNGFFSRYSIKEQLFVRKSDRIYSLAMTSKGMDKSVRDNEFRKFLDGLSIQ